MKQESGYFDDLDKQVASLGKRIFQSYSATDDQLLMVTLIDVMNDIRLRMEDHRPIFVEPKPTGTPKNMPDGTNGGRAWRKA